jgi:hypothetical protein
MAGPRRIELILMGLIMVLGAYLVRDAYIPPYSDRHIAIAEEKYRIEVGSPSEWFSAWSIGDGVVYAVIAADPTGAKLGVEIKEPAYRFSRAGFAWVVWLVTLGEETRIPYGLAAVGAAAMIANLALASLLRPRLGPKAWFLVFNPAIYLGFAGDTAEPLGALLLAACLGSGSLVATAALGVTRPTYLIAIWGRWRQLGLGMAAAGALAMFSLWRFGADRFLPDGGRVGLPLLSYVENSTVAGWFLALLALATVLWGVRRRDWAWVITGLFILCFGADVTLNPTNAWRAAGPLFVIWAFGTDQREASTVDTWREPASVPV